MMDTLAWKRYCQTLAAAAKMSQDAIRVNDSTANPQLALTAGKTLFPMLQAKGHIPVSYKFVQCVEIVRKGRKGSGTPAKGHRQEVQGVAYTRQDMLVFHNQLLQACNIVLPRPSQPVCARSIRKGQPLTRTRMAADILARD